MYALLPRSARHSSSLVVGIAALVLLACGAAPQDEASLERELAASEADAYRPVETVEVTVYDYPMHDESTAGTDVDGDGVVEEQERSTSGIRQIIIRHYPPGYDLEAAEAEADAVEASELEAGEADPASGQ